jgi:hypothetical protein
MKRVSTFGTHSLTGLSFTRARAVCLSAKQHRTSRILLPVYWVAEVGRVNCWSWPAQWCLVPNPAGLDDHILLYQDSGSRPTRDPASEALPILSYIRVTLTTLAVKCVRSEKQVSITFRYFAFWLTVISLEVPVFYGESVSVNNRNLFTIIRAFSRKSFYLGGAIWVI